MELTRAKTRGEEEDLKLKEEIEPEAKAPARSVNGAVAAQAAKARAGRMPAAPAAVEKESPAATQQAAPIAAKEEAPAALKDVDEDAAEALLITFPDYLIETETRLGKVGGLGHAGVLLIRADGFTRYYEYGRYATSDGTKGRVRKVGVPDVEIGEDGKATEASLSKVLGAISAKSGQGGRIDAAYFQNVNFAVMEAYAQQKLKESNPGNPEYDKKRDPYTLTGNNCGTFAEDVVTQDKDVDQPSIWVNSPTNIVEEYQQEGNAQVTYDPKAEGGPSLEIGEFDEEDAKKRN